MGRKKSDSANISSEVFKKINDRLKSTLSPGIDLVKHIDFTEDFRPPSFPNNRSSLNVGSTTLGGVSFKPKRAERLKSLFFAARSLPGDQAFANLEATPDHWALKISFGNTNGTGFREITRMPLNFAGQNLEESGISRSFGGMFASSSKLPKLTSLHAAVSKDVFSIHIDEMAFVLELKGSDQNYGLSPDFLQHTVNEYFYKEALKGAMPEALGWFFDHSNIVVPNSRNDYSPRVGMNLELNPIDEVKITLQSNCHLYTGEKSITANLGINF